MSDAPEIATRIAEFRHEALKARMEYSRKEEPAWLRPLLSAGYALAEYAAAPHADSAATLLAEYRNNERVSGNG